MPTPSGSPKVLCYQPYNLWRIHGLWDMTICHGLRLRGAEVQYVICDGLFTDCDVHWASQSPRPPDACRSCQAEVTRRVADVGMDWTWLGRYLDPADPGRARAWVDGLTAEELLTARLGDWDVAAWVRGSVHTHFRRSHLDPADAATQAVLRSYLFSGAVACFALDRLLDAEAPDVFLLFNGRQSSTRVALELATRKGIRTITHERGLRDRTLLLTEDDQCSSLRGLRAAWAAWRDVPLTRAELEAVTGHLLEREHGTGTNWPAFNGERQSAHVARAALGLSPARPTWTLLTSSDDEVVAERDWQGPLEQLEWVRRTIAFAGAHPEIDLVVRVHPNTGSRRSSGTNTALRDALRALAEDLPPNVRFVHPEDELSTYALLDITTVGLVFHSLAGLELACRGRAVVAASGGTVTGMPFVTTVTGAAAYETQLEGLLALPAGHCSAEVRRGALRLAHLRWFRTLVDFPLVRRKGLDGELAWAAVDELAPGRDAGLDRCARILLDEEPVVPPPGPAERARTTADEDAVLATVPRPRTQVVAHADELVRERGLLTAWRDSVRAADPVTLVIATPAGAAHALVDAVAEAGLDGDEGPDLLAVAEDEVPDLPELLLSTDPVRGALVLRLDEATLPAFAIQARGHAVGVG